jgi:hypothetical protein
MVGIPCEIHGMQICVHTCHHIKTAVREKNPIDGYFIKYWFCESFYPSYFCRVCVDKFDLITDRTRTEDEQGSIAKVVQGTCPLCFELFFTDLTKSDR